VARGCAFTSDGFLSSFFDTGFRGFVGSWVLVCSGLGSAAFRIEVDRVGFGLGSTVFLDRAFMGDFQGEEEV